MHVFFIYEMYVCVCGEFFNQVQVHKLSACGQRDEIEKLVKRDASGQGGWKMETYWCSYISAAPQYRTANEKNLPQGSFW